jgi:uncharacterized membrane protein
MTDRRFTLIDTATLALIVVLIALAAGVALFGPTAHLAMHFDLAGRPDRWGSRYELAGWIGFMAVMAAITAGAMGWYAKRSTDPSRRRGLIIGQLVSLVAIGGTSALLCWVILGRRAASGDSILPWTMVLLGLILAVTGAFLGRVAPNPLIGVRTPWSFKSRLAWDRSNRLAGRLLFWLGLLALVAAPWSPQPVGLIAMTVVLVIACAWPVFESWRVWRTDPDRQAF